MTQNQIAYWNLKENERSNKEKESISKQQADAATLKSLTDKALAEFETDTKFRSDNKKYLGDFILKWGANLGGALGKMLN